MYKYLCLTCEEYHLELFGFFCFDHLGCNKKGKENVSAVDCTVFVFHVFEVVIT